MEKLDELKLEATELGIQFKSNVTEKALADKIEAHYRAAEQAAAPVAIVDTADNTKGASNTGEVDNARSRMRKLAKELEVAARKTRVVTIIDNDQRINNVATSCTVNCSNAYFDLGTVILPLNDKVEVRVGHLEVLASVKIPQHVKDPNNPSVSKTVMRPRYSIQEVTVA